MSDDEETQAEEYRQSLVRRQAYHIAAAARIHGDGAVREAFRQKWEAVGMWLAERRRK